MSKDWSKLGEFIKNQSKFDPKIEIGRESMRIKIKRVQKIEIKYPVWRKK